MDDRENNEGTTIDERHDLVLIMAAGAPHVMVCPTKAAAEELQRRIEGRRDDWIKCRPDMTGQSLHFPRAYLTGLRIRPHVDQPAPTTAIVGAPEPATDGTNGSGKPIEPGA